MQAFHILVLKHDVARALREPFYFITVCKVHILRSHLFTVLCKLQCFEQLTSKVICSSFKTNLIPDLLFLKPLISRCKNQWVDMIFSFSFLARGTNPFKDPTTEGAPSVLMRTRDSHDEPTGCRYAFRLLIFFQLWFIRIPSNLKKILHFSFR